MSNNKNRKRNSIINFRVTEEEKFIIENMINFSGKSKQEYFTEHLLEKEVYIYYGKFESDRLSVEIKRIRRELEKLSNQHNNNEQIFKVLKKLEILYSMLIVSRERNQKYV